MQENLTFPIIYNSIYPMSEFEKTLVTMMAIARFNYSRANNVPIPDHRAKWNRDQNIEYERDAFGAELAFCGLVNCYPDFQFQKPEPYDAIYMNQHVDIKQTVYKTGKLMVNTRKTWDIVPDFFALVIGSFPNYQLKGFFPGEELLKDERITQVKHTDQYTVYQNELRPMMNWLVALNYRSDSEQHGA